MTNMASLSISPPMAPFEAAYAWRPSVSGCVRVVANEISGPQKSHSSFEEEESS
jgi:hypothetical protein